jgi:hypothetical protein
MPAALDCGGVNVNPSQSRSRCGMPIEYAVNLAL